MTTGTTRLRAEIGACQGCGACLLTCPVHAIRPGPDANLVVFDTCTGCGDCVEICPVDAIDLIATDLIATDLIATDLIATDLIPTDLPGEARR